MATINKRRFQKTRIEIVDEFPRQITIRVNGTEIDAWIEGYSVEKESGNRGSVMVRLMCSEIDVTHPAQGEGAIEDLALK